MSNPLTKRGGSLLFAGLLAATAGLGGAPSPARAAVPAAPAAENTTVPDEAGSVTALKSFDIQSSAHVTDSPEKISNPDYRPTGWHSAGTRSTVLAALVADGTYPDPFHSTNMKNIPKA